jgi:hypothetical protein
MLETTMHVPGLGEFLAERDEYDDEIYCYSKAIQFRGSAAELLIYSNEDESPLTGEQKERLRQQFLKFERSVDAALNEGTEMVRRVFAEWGIDTRHLPDSQFWNGHRWTNVKLEGDEIECSPTLNSSSLSMTSS